MNTLTLDVNQFQSAVERLMAPHSEKLHFAWDGTGEFEHVGRRWIPTTQYGLILTTFPADRLIVIEQEHEEGDPFQRIIFIFEAAEFAALMWTYFVSHYQGETSDG